MNNIGALLNLHQAPLNFCERGSQNRRSSTLFARGAAEKARSLADVDRASAGQARRPDEIDRDAGEYATSAALFLRASARKMRSSTEKHRKLALLQRSSALYVRGGRGFFES